MFKIGRSAVTYRIGYYCITESQFSRQFSNISFRNKFLQKSESKSTICASFVRFASNATAGVSVPDIVVKPSTETLIDKIPEPPPLPPADFTEQITEAIKAVSSNGEPTLESLGMGGWSPVGLIQSGMEFLHVSCALPWWGTIVVTTIVMRTLLLPLVLISQRNSANLNNYLPEVQTLQMKMTQARQSGNQIDAARYSQEMMIFFKDKGVNPLKNMLVPLVQAPIFISFFLGLRRMASCPVESMTCGGLFWFIDLTVPDQYFLLPILTSATLAITIELGVDGAKATQNMAIVKYFLRAIPLVMLPFTINIPAAILLYWCSANVISLVQVCTLKIPKVRAYCKIPPPIKFAAHELPIQSKGFVQEAKNSWANMKITKEMQERLRVDEQLFNQAGKASIKKTFKYDPTKMITIQAKKQS